MKGCARVYTCPACGFQVIIQPGRTIELCECMSERLAIYEESRQAQVDAQALAGVQLSL
jgi:hypothetical protein